MSATEGQADQSVWTEFETEARGCGTVSVDENVLWGAYCPQDHCGELNLFEGQPSEFANRPFRCVECHWVSLMDESVAEIESDLPEVEA